MRNIKNIYVLDMTSERECKFLSICLSTFTYNLNNLRKVNKFRFKVFLANLRVWILSIVFKNRIYFPEVPNSFIKM